MVVGRISCAIEVISTLVDSTEGYFNDVSRKLYSRDYKRTDFIPLSEITLVVPDDMELQYDGDRAVGTQGHPQKLFPDDSANWYKDSKKLKENMILRIIFYQKSLRREN